MISFFYTFIPVILGFIVSLFTDTSAYQNINKPFNIPSIIFPIIWTIIYLAIGYASYRTSKDKPTFKLFYINLAINLIWGFIFFNLGMYFNAFILILVMIFLEIILIIRYKKLDKVSYIINIIYLLWLIFAAYLNLSIYILN